MRFKQLSWAVGDTNGDGNARTSARKRTSAPLSFQACIRPTSDVLTRLPSIAINQIRNRSGPISGIAERQSVVLSEQPHRLAAMGKRQRPAPAACGPIHRAAWEGDLEEVVRLIEADGELLNAHGPEDPEGAVTLATPLMLAAGQGRDAVVERLLALGADAEPVDNSRRIALYWACEDDRAGSVQLLLDAGAALNVYVNVYDDNGTTPQMIAVDWGNSLHSVPLLLARGGHALDLDAREHDTGNTALYNAVAERR